MNQKYFARLKRIERLVSKKDFHNPEVLEFWKGLVRDPNGRWINYHSKGIKYFQYGKQSRPDLNSKIQLALVKSSIKHEKAFLYGLKYKSLKNLKEWLTKLHKKQIYTGNGGQILSKRRISMGEHSQIAKASILTLARKYDDPYTNTGTQTVYLPRIDPKGYPMDKWENKSKVIHYYPDPKYFDQYLEIMKNMLKRFILKTEGAADKEILVIIANYYQYAINMHLFEDINQSLFANQVNAMLKQIGLRPIGHGILDFVAMRLQPKNFAKYFIDEVKRVNKDVLN